jgi:pimeloyl-ACP methyl ester carboxylesterase
MERAFTGSARVEVVTLPGEGHFLPWEHEALVREVIGAVVRGDAASGP